MNDLASNACEACRIDAPKVSDDEVNILLKEIDNWDLIHEKVKQLKKIFSFSRKYMEYNFEKLRKFRN